MIKWLKSWLRKIEINGGVVVIFGQMKWKKWKGDFYLQLTTTTTTTTTTTISTVAAVMAAAVAAAVGSGNMESE